MQHTITLKPVWHRKEERILLQCAKDKYLNNAIRRLSGVKWSQSLSCWHIPCTDEAYKEFKAGLKSICNIEKKLLKAYLEKRNIALQAHPEAKTTAGIAFAQYVNKANLELLALTIEQLKLKGYSASTIKTYRAEIAVFMKTLRHHNADGLQTDDIRRYILKCIEKDKLSENSIHSKLNALKFMYEQVLKKEKFFIEIPRPKKPMALPKVLGEVELGRLFRGLKNKKHKAMLFTAYSAGLRVSEIAALKLQHIDSDRMQILVKNAKGKKDRYVNLSPVLLDILRDYIKTSNPRPKEYLFESEATGTCFPTRTIQQVFRNAKAAAKISKSVGIHSLRHSFATHLLEKGTDIYYIKELLGHFNIKTTEIYLHVSKKSLVNVTSPLDDLVRKGVVEW